MRLLGTVFITALIVVGLGACNDASDSANNTSAEDKAEPSKPADTAASPATSPAETAGKKDEAPKSDLKPEDIDPAKPIPVAELKAAFSADEKAWIGKEVTVIGKYAKTTTSSLPSGDRIRVDLSDAKTNERSVGCIVKEEPPQELAKQRLDRVFKGTIKEASFGNPSLEPCEFVK